MMQNIFNTIIQIPLPFILGFPFFTSLLTFIIRKSYFITVVGSVLTFSIILFICYAAIFHGYESDLSFFSSGLPIKFHITPMGAIFATLTTFLWIWSNLYTNGYFSIVVLKRKNLFFAFFALSMFCVVCIAFAENLITFFVFYELLTFATYPLITYDKTSDAFSAGRVYILVLFSASMILLLTAIMLILHTFDSTSFVKGGFFLDNSSISSLTILFFMFVYGMAKAALFPLHIWLPRAMVAHTPVSALLHAVAVVKSGVFGLMKVICCVFGIHLLSKISQDYTIVSFPKYIAIFTVLYSGVHAIKQDSLKAMLAYSTIGQLSYIIMCLCMYTEDGAKVAFTSIIAHALAKIVLFFCAGAIYVKLGKKNISEMHGIAYAMPITCIALTLASCSIIGLPPTLGMINKMHIMRAAFNVSDYGVILTMIIGSIMSTTYLIPFLWTVYDMSDKKYTRRDEAPAQMLVPIVLIAALIVILFFSHSLFFDIFNILEF